MLELNITGTATQMVTKENTAKAMGSGALEVFATPAMTALMEKAACNCLEGRLEEGETSVGTSLEIRHTSATPVGMKVSCEAQLIEMELPRLVFSVTAYDEARSIGSGIHERYIVNADKFMEKAYSKVKK